MKCLVTGATGFIGRELCRLLSHGGHQLCLYSFSGQPLEDGTPTRAIDFRVDNISVDELSSVDVVFHLAGIAHQRAAASDYERVNHLATVELARRAREAGVGCFLFLSSVKAMGNAQGNAPRSESESVRPGDAYGLSKWCAERDLHSVLKGAQMRVCILRPALVYGAGVKGNLAFMSRAVQRGLPRPPEDGGRSMIAVSDLCELMLLLSQERAAGMDTYIVTDGEHYSTRRIYDALRRAHDRAPGAAWCPRWVWRLACRLLDWLRPGGEPTWQKLFARELYDNSRVLHETSWRPQRCLEDSLEKVLNRS